MRKPIHDPSAPQRRPEKPERFPLRGTELRRPPFHHSIRGRQQAQGARNIPRRHGR
ncbi:hypothetical protein ACIBU0_07580 [Streptomyces sp. NPDC049627]|uniref:hypothetical protein n=1 Tax=Streptomyces sp. NPDC049627 TaxID=3365595 RepID=UPI0037BB3898